MTWVEEQRYYSWGTLMFIARHESSQAGGSGGDPASPPSPLPVCKHDLSSKTCGTSTGTRQATAGYNRLCGQGPRGGSGTAIVPGLRWTRCARGLTSPVQSRGGLRAACARCEAGGCDLIKKQTNANQR